MISLPPLPYRAVPVLPVAAAAVLIFSMAVPADTGIAQTNGSQQVKDQKGDKAPEPGPVEAYRKATETMMADLSREELKKFQAIRHVHGIIKAVQRVSGLVERAVNSCMRENPGMENTLKPRFLEWRRTLRPVLTRAEQRETKLILLQDFAKPSEMREVLEAFDRAVTYQDKKINRIPVSDLAACERLHTRMDETQEELYALLVEEIGLDDMPGRDGSGI